ncbi:MAG: hypothetical protein ABIH23_23215 [bacterium]
MVEERARRIGETVNTPTPLTSDKSLTIMHKFTPSGSDAEKVASLDCADNGGALAPRSLRFHSPPLLPQTIQSGVTAAALQRPGHSCLGNRSLSGCSFMLD